MVRNRTRRELLRAGLVSGTVLLAGCSGGGTDTENDEGDGSTPTATPDDGDTTATETPGDETPTDDESRDDEEQTLGDPVWPMARYDLGATGRNPDAVGPGEKPEVDWDTELDGTVTSTPITTESKVFVVTDEDTLYGLSADDGSIEWTDDLDGEGKTPALGDGMLYVPHAGITAYDPETGEQQWHYDDGGQKAATPVLYADGMVFAGIDNGTGDSAILATTADGRREWRQTNLTVGTGTPTPTALSSAGSELYVATKDPGVLVLARGRGSRKEVLDIGPTSWLAIDGSLFAYGGTDAGFENRSDGSGHRLTDRVNYVRDATAPLVTDEFVVWGTETGPNDTEHGMMALERDRGLFRWSRGFSTSIPHPPVSSRDHIYRSGREWVYCASTSGARIWQTKLDGVITTQMTVSDGRLYLGLDGDDASRLVALAEPA